jgi:hypothetical protein
MKTFFIDFDGTICPNHGNNPDYAEPSVECKLFLQKLRDSGCKIVIYSVRSNLRETFKQNGHAEMIEYLEKHKIPYDEIDCNKRHFTYMIDDKCMGVPLDSDGNVDWKIINQMYNNP